MATATGKTVVAFKAMDQYLDQLRSGAKDQHPGAVLFVVNK